MESTYRKIKEDVLKDYKYFVEMIDEIRQGKETPYDHSMEALEAQAENIKKDKFMLMVVGEAKSGKSTFINAYLKKEILPMDVKQCTSAIVEIKDGPAYKLTATYADDRQESFDDEKDIKEFLVANAAMDDDYRDIPVSLINIALLMKWKDKRASETDIVNLLNCVEDDNIYHLPKEEYQRKIREYIAKRKPQWRELVKTITIEYPFEDKELKGIEIVDTPGVNAEGKVGDITDHYVEEANAVMFLKPITGAALEASSFKKFLNSKSADRNRNAMFLLLTRAANETEQNTKKILAEALKQFPSISEHQIIPVDSKAELFANRIADLSVEDLRKMLMELTAKKELDSFLALPWFIAGGDKVKYIDEIKKLSNFIEIRDALNLFAHRAEYLALSGLLERMISVLKQAEEKLKESIENNELKAKDPLELNNKLLNAKRGLENLKRKINETVDQIADKYSLPGGEIEKKANAVMDDYRREIAAINVSASNSVDELEKISFQKIDIFKKEEADLQKDIVKECDDALIKYSENASINYKTLKPDLTKETIEKIKTEKKKDAYETQYYTTGKTFKKTESYSEFSQSKFFGIIKESIDSRIETIKGDAISDLQDFVVQVSTAYREELTRNAKLQQREYDEILQEKQTAEELQELIKVSKEQLERLEDFHRRIESVKGGIDKNVG